MVDDELNCASWLLPTRNRLLAAERNRCLPHAILISGPRGVGKSTLANALLSWLLCERADRGDVACGECRGCSLRAAATHPDLALLAPEPGKATIGVDQVRAVISYVQLTSSYGGRKLVFCEAVELLNIAAANTLLKILEEPPGTTLFVLTSSRPDSLPATVRSRCSRVRIATPPPESALGWLTSRGLRPDEAADGLALSGGAPLRALQLLESGYVPALRLLVENVSALVRGQVEPITTAAGWSKLSLSDVIDGVWYATSELIRFESRSATTMSRQAGSEAIDSRALFRALDTCARLRALSGSRSLSANEHAMALQRLAIGCALVHRMC